jgi:hypothetical protein
MAALIDVSSWLDANTGPDFIWYIKRLAANDTLASGGHQAGPYIPKDFLFSVFPSINRPDAENPEKRFELRVDSHSDVREVRAVWYNNKMRGGTRNEARLTNFGGSQSPLLDPDSTGALTVFSFRRDVTGEASVCNVWVCDAPVQEDLVEDRVGPIEPGESKVWSLEHGGVPAAAPPSNCSLQPRDIPDAWLKKFPTGLEIIKKTLELRPSHGMQLDVRLMKRRTCEYEIFRSLEEAVELPLLHDFSTVDEFVAKAQSILQRRKSRTGNSLEYHAREIFIEENLREDQDFEHKPESEDGKKPDFLFPSAKAYRDPDFPASRLRMLAAKTTMKDRWRQILNEANRVKTKHLLTLQEGVSEGQFREMADVNVQLVVPAPLISSYPESVRPHLQTLESFIADIRLLNLD